jgi:sec-independent protein translocase protein TatA
MLGLRLPELLLILLVVVLLFGAKKLPELGDSLGKGIRAFKKASEHAFDKDASSDATPQQGELPHGSATNAPPSAATEKTEKKV